MQNRNQKQQGFFASLIGEKTFSKRAGLTYTVSAFFFFLTSMVLVSVIGENSGAEWALYLNYLAAPIAFLLTSLWYFFGEKVKIKEFVKEQKCPPKYYLLALLLQVGLFSLGELNGLFLKFLSRFGYQDKGILLPNMDGVGFVGVLLAVAILPALLEELFFRGIFLRDMKELSLLSQVLLCGGLFALYHQNPAQTLYQFICGCAFALVAVRAGGFLPTVLSHFVNNAVILILYKVGITSFGGPMYVIMLIVSVVCLLASLGYLLFVDGKKKEKQEGKKGAYAQFFACAGIGIFLFAFSWIATLLMGF